MLYITYIRSVGTTSTHIPHALVIALLQKGLAHIGQTTDSTLTADVWSALLSAGQCTCCDCSYQGICGLVEFVAQARDYLTALVANMYRHGLTRG